MKNSNQDDQKKTLRILSQGLIFTLSPLVIPSLLSLGLVLLSFFSGDWLEIISIPLMFSMVLITIPATITGLVVSVIRKILCFRNHRINGILWITLTFTVSAALSTRFMAFISLQFIELAALMGVLSALISCSMIMFIEYKRTISVS